jgi:hypothetical protein
MLLLLGIKVFDDSGICMVLLRMMSFIKYEKIDSIHRDERVVETLAKYLRCADYDHVL